MYISIFAIVVAAIVSGKQIKGSIDFNKFLKSYAQENKTEILSTKISMGLYILQLIPIAVCIICAVYIYVEPNQIKDSNYYVTLFIMLAIIFSSTLFTGKMYGCLYYTYTEDGFLWENSLIRFSNIRELKSSKIKAAEVILKNGKSVNVTRRQQNIIKDICESKKLRVKIS